MRAFVTNSQVVIRQSLRMFKKAAFSPAHPACVERTLFPWLGRSERTAEEVHTKLRLSRSLRSYASGEVLFSALRYVEGLSDARTKPAVFFNVRLVGEDYGTNQPLGATGS